MKKNFIAIVFMAVFCVWFSIGASVDTVEADPVETYTFEVKAGNGSQSEVKAVSNIYTKNSGGNVYDNEIETVGIGANANFEATMNCNCDDSYFKVTADNHGDIAAQSNTWSDVGTINGITISTVAIGANAAGSYTSGHSHSN